MGVERMQQVQQKQASLSQAATVDDAHVCTSTSCYKFYNSKTKPYFVDQFPEIPFKTGEFYSGSIPIDESDPSRTLFFIFKPASNATVEEVTIWLNGGPGCSSMAGFFQENAVHIEDGGSLRDRESVNWNQLDLEPNPPQDATYADHEIFLPAGPILMQPGTEGAAQNPFAWSTLTNMIWVDQPVGAGLSTGKPEANNEVEAAKEFVGFFKNFQKIFGTEKYKTYVTGESYAGRYVPYISAEMLDQNMTVGGALVYDPCIGDCGYVQMEVPTYQFVKDNNLILNINETFLGDLEKISQDCGYTDYMNKYLVYPPSGHQPPSKTNIPNKCDISYAFEVAWNDINPCPNVYYIADFCPTLYGQNGELISDYLNQAKVKQALHAPAEKWKECANKVFKHGDSSPDSILGALPQVIEATNRVLVGNADWDALILTDGVLLAIQNMTWNGKLGFQSEPSDDLVIPIADPQQFAGPQGIMGKKHYERGLQWVETYQSGHMQPQFQPRVAYRHLQWLLGRIDDL